jgi:hypothetical protein
VTIDRVTAEQQEMRDFVDALRAFLGKAPLYHQGVQVEVERFGGIGSVLPATASRPDEWFRPAEAVDEGRTRDRSVELAVRKLTRSGRLEKPRQDRTTRWRADTSLDPHARESAFLYGRWQFRKKGD